MSVLTSDPAAAQRHWRALAVARPGMLALVVALTGSARSFVDDWWWLGALALVALAAAIAERVMPPSRLRAAAEMGLASIVIGLGFPDAYLALPYLLLPAFAGGLAGGAAGAILATIIAGMGMAAGDILARNALLNGTSAGSLAAWLVIVFVTGAIGAWLLRQENVHVADGERYAAAYRLLSELRVVSRRLSGGLDPMTLAEGILDHVASHIDVRRSALLVRRDGGVLFPLARRGDDDGWLVGAEKDPVVLDAWTNEVPAWAPAGRRGYRVVLPLRVGSRTIGAVVADVPEQVSSDELAELARSTDEGAVRLETALLFDEVRELATREERQRLAREIHDGIAQELASLGYLVDDLLARTTNADAASLATTLRRELTRIVTELRHSVFDLRSDLDRDAGLGETLSGYARQIGAQARLNVHLVNQEGQERLRPEVEAELLRIGQEAITNVRKHAKARNLWVTVSVNPPSAHIRVADDGTGMRERPSDRYGLDIMSERARRIGATLVIEDAPEGGTVVSVSLGNDYEEGLIRASDGHAGR
ncbi:sensor histidine kinase [Phytoactinopolyspora halotolerans]|uniref:Sensor histidine kinase n=1 Tax=Phytoactinopolyspora halotolerans TaxID=1981512 RepID=A0A6L9S9P7_9ACTN|nr:sensor histidine kinase [Phytoactinopolyspora halotolerans]NEE01797.1 sensor histidine kinase [Phytoactinopolyspora halotolerans]